MNWIKKLFRKRDTALSKPVVSGSFKEWYLEYRIEMAKAFNADYAICIASWTFSENHEKYFIKGQRISLFITRKLFPFRIFCENPLIFVASA